MITLVIIDGEFFDNKIWSKRILHINVDRSETILKNFPDC